MMPVWIPGDEAAGESPAFLKAGGRAVGQLVGPVVGAEVVNRVAQGHGKTFGLQIDAPEAAVRQVVGVAPRQGVSAGPEVV